MVMVSVQITAVSKGVGIGLLVITKKLIASTDTYVLECKKSWLHIVDSVVSINSYVYVYEHTYVRSYG